MVESNTVVRHTGSIEVSKWESQQPYIHIAMCKKTKEMGVANPLVKMTTEAGDILKMMKKAKETEATE